MPRELYLKKAEENSFYVNYGNNWHPTTTATQPAVGTVPMVSQEAIDTDMTDKVVSEAPKQEPPKATEENKGWLQKICNRAERAYEKAAALAAKGTDWEWLMRHVNKFEDIDDDTAETLTEANAQSEFEEFQAQTAVKNAQIKDVKRQLAVAQRIIPTANETVQMSYANNYHTFHEDNQAPTAETLTTYAVNEEINIATTENAKNCAVKSQANVADAIAKGTLANENLNETQKANCGVKLAQEIKNFDKTQQAQAYTATANNFHKYDAVVKETQNQVANYASDDVRAAVIKGLEKSQHQNVRDAFTAEAIKQAQIAFKAANNGNITADEAEKIRQTVEKVIAAAEKEIEKTENTEEKTEEKAESIYITQEIIQENKPEVKLTNPFDIGKKDSKATDNNKTGIITYQKKYVTHTQKLVAEHGLADCKTADAFVEKFRELSKVDKKNLLEQMGTVELENLFKNTSSASMQVYLLKNGYVDYISNKKHCLPSTNIALNNKEKELLQEEHS